jgi:hypothetical protein
MSMCYKNPHLSHIATEPLSRLVPWSQQLVRRRYALDARLSKSGKPDGVREFVACLPPRWVPTWKTISPWMFIRAVLPVAEVELVAGGKNVAFYGWSLRSSLAKSAAGKPLPSTTTLDIHVEAVFISIGKCQLSFI